MGEIILIIVGIIFIFIIFGKREKKKKEKAYKSKISEVEQSYSSNNPPLESVKIGEQLWLKNNLIVSTFNNGDPIPQIKSDSEWLEALNKKQPAWCYYDYLPSNGRKYGILYNWYVINDHRGLAPEGWHIPSLSEFEKLISTLNGPNKAGYKLKSSQGWSNSGNGSNESGFSGLPAGCVDDAMSILLKDSGYWWSTTKKSDSYAYALSLFKLYDKATLEGQFMGNGYSIRCIKD